MPLTFGPFLLDEDARSLMLGNEPHEIQPRVFDFLAYLVKNAGRVVPKDELLDALWPGVIVTESSLQRAASLARRTLAAGKIEHALRNFARRGYRFALDESNLGVLTPQPASSDPVGVARDAMHRGDWAAATAAFDKASRLAPLDADDLELWALADECRGRPVAAIPALHKAIEMHIAAGRADRAARAAVTLSKVELERGSAAAAQGWLDRAEAILGNFDSLAARAYFLWMKSRLAAFGGDAGEALLIAGDAAELASTSGDPGLHALTMVYKGFYHLSLGQVDDGNRLQNHAAAIALSSQIDPMTGSLVYCNILWSCRTFADWERALQWSDGFEAWCDAIFAQRPGSCDLHRAEILGARGTLAEAFAKISEALPKLVDEEAWSLGDGYRVRGDIAAMMGELGTAEADYAMAYSLGWDAEPGNAVLLFEKGQPEAALNALDRALEGRSWFHLQRRGVLLANAARIAAKAALSARAEHYLAELEAAGERWSQPTVRAMIAEARAALIAPADPAATQLRLLARQLWTSARFDYHAARVRLELAANYIGAGDIAGAQAELGAVERTVERLGSRRLARECAGLRKRASSEQSASLVAVGQR